MKKIILFSIASLGLLSLHSCSSVAYSYRAVDVNKKNLIAQEVVVDVKLDVKNKISSTSSKRKSVDEAIDEAYYKAIVDNNIDVVVDPIFEVTTSGKRPTNTAKKSWWLWALIAGAVFSVVK